MAYRKISQTTSKATRGLIEEFATMTMAKMDRPLSPRRLNALREKVVAGKFTTAVWASAKCKQDGRVYRLNGKHTSTLFHQMNGELPKGIELTVIRFECDTLQDIAELYSTFDPRISVRTQADINRIYAASCEDIEGVPIQIVNLCVTGICYAEREDDYRSRTSEERAAKIVGNEEFILWVNDFIGHDRITAKHMIRGPVCAAMFQAWCKNPEACKKFWSLVKTGDSKSDCPTRKLERMLLSSRIKAGSSGLLAKAIGSREMYVKCIHAWNAWRQGKTSDLKYYANADTPEVK